MQREDTETSGWMPWMKNDWDPGRTIGAKSDPEVGTQERLVHMKDRSFRRRLGRHANADVQSSSHTGY